MMGWKAGLCNSPMGYTDHDLLATRSLQLQEQLNGLTTVVTTHMSRTRKGFRVAGGVMATLAVITLGLIAWFQIYPSAVPETVKKQLTGLSLGLHQQATGSEVMRGDVTQISAHVTALNAQVKRQSDEMATLRAESRKMARAVQSIRAALGGIQRNVAGIRQDLSAVQAQVNTPAQTVSPDSVLPTVQR